MMDYLLNSTPVRTANNFGINDILVSIDDKKATPFENIMIITSEMDKLEIINQNSNNIQNSKIGMELEKNYEILMF